MMEFTIIIENENFYIWLCSSKLYFMFSCMFCSIWFIISMTFDRFYSIIMPHKAASFNTVKRTKITILCISVFGILFSIPHWFLSWHQSWLCLPFGHTVNMEKIHSQIYYWISFMLSFASPFALLLTMNCFIIHTLRTRMGKKLNKSNGEGQKEMSSFKVKNDDKQVYVILLLVTFAFLIVTSPAFIFFVVNLLHDFTKTPKKFAGHYLFAMVAQYLQLSNYGINFFLYVISGQKFRNDLVNIFSFKKRKIKDNFSSDKNTGYAMSIAEGKHNATKNREINTVT